MVLDLQKNWTNSREFSFVTSHISLHSLLLTSCINVVHLLQWVSQCCTLLLNEVHCLFRFLWVLSLLFFCSGILFRISKSIYSVYALGLLRLWRFLRLSLFLMAFDSLITSGLSFYRMPLCWHCLISSSWLDQSYRCWGERLQRYHILLKERVLNVTCDCRCWSRSPGPSCVGVRPRKQGCRPCRMECVVGLCSGLCKAF